jgi:predicted RNA-binding Zn-ribbon protein involved in translation (DUF1610 family)
MASQGNPCLMPKDGKKKTLVCPQCGSADIFYENAMITGYKYHCKACDYIGALVLEKRE